MGGPHRDVNVCQDCGQLRRELRRQLRCQVWSEVRRRARTEVRCEDSVPGRPSEALHWGWRVS